MKTAIKNAEALNEAVQLLKRGELVSFPTETVYGLGASFFDEAAQNKIFTVKGRPIDNPLIVHIHCFEKAENLAENIPPSFWTLSQKFLPGPLTLILKKNSAIDPKLTRGLSTIALRIPAHKTARALLSLFDAPLVAPSANLSGKPSPTTAQDVFEDLEGKIPLIIDGGACPIGIESTVLSLAHEKPLLLRPGSLAKEELEEALSEKIDFYGEEKTISPGMKYKHYAPKTPIYLFSDLEKMQNVEGNVLSLILGKNLTRQNLYAQFREADRLQKEAILIYTGNDLKSDHALFNRIQKAAYAENHS